MAEKIMWQVWAQSDMTEGRGGMTPMAGHVFAYKQDAWDSINDKGGVMGRRPGVNCYPMDKLKDAGVTRWQEYEAVVGFVGDYDVRPVEVAQPRATPASGPDGPTVVEDLRSLLVELEPDEVQVADLRGLLAELED